MTVSKALREGMRRLRAAWWIVALLYAATTALALAVTAAVMTLVANSLAHSALAQQMTRNFDIEWIAELIAAHGSILAAPWPATIFGACALFAVLYLLLLGGVVETLGACRGDFFAGCGRHFWRLARLAVWSGIACAAVLAAAGGVGAIGRKIFGEGSVAAPLIYWSWLRLALTFCGLAGVNLAFEYAAIAMAAEDSRRSLRAFFAAWRLLTRRPVRMLGLYAVLYLILIVPVAAGFAISRAMSQTSMASVATLFVIRQATVLAKTWAWLLFIPAQAALWEALRPAPVAQPVAPAVAEPAAVSEAPPAWDAEAPLA